MPSNRSKKNIFQKDADETLKRQLISSEFKKYVASKVTGQSVTNGTDASQLLSLNEKYMILENYYNEKLALFITDIRREIAEKVESNDLSVPLDPFVPWGKAQEAEKVESNDLSVRKGKAQEHKEERIKRMESGLIPEKDFNVYWEERLKLSKELSKYNILIDKYDDNMTRESIIRYIEAVNSLIRSKYGFPAPVTCMTRKHYDTILKIYDENKDTGLDFPGWPEEYITKN